MAYGNEWRPERGRQRNSQDQAVVATKRSNCLFLRRRPDSPFCSTPAVSWPNERRAACSADRSSVWVFCGSFSAWIREQEKRIMSGNRIKDISDRRVKLWSGEWMIKHNHKSQPDEMKPLSHQLGLCWEGIYTSFGLTEGVIVGLYNLIRSHWKSKILIKIKKYLPI